jgi:hypothetical protein
VPKAPGVYLFIAGGIVKYVGSAQKSLHARMKSYERRQRDQKLTLLVPQSTRPIHRELGKAIDGHKAVEVHTLVIPNPLQDGVDGLPIDYAIGLEAGLIQAVNPAWNRRGRTLLLDDIDT